MEPTVEKGSADMDVWLGLSAFESAVPATMTDPASEAPAQRKSIRETRAIDIAVYPGAPQTYKRPLVLTMQAKQDRKTAYVST
eukprot:5277754-Alexandrium_andersonii.AAC.1